VVYFIAGEDTKLAKIGKAQNVVARLRHLQAMSPDKLTVLAVILNEDDDHKYHRLFAASWSHAEWFRLTPEVREFISSIPESEYNGVGIRVENYGVRSGAAAASSIGSPHLKPRQSVSARSQRQRSWPPTREGLAAHVLWNIPFAKPGSSTQLALMRQYARLTGWKSWRDVPEFAALENHYAN
jgi:hypothetical protein